MRTFDPGAGTWFPSQVEADDQGPLWRDWRKPVVVSAGAGNASAPAAKLARNVRRCSCRSMPQCPLLLAIKDDFGFPGCAFVCADGFELIPLEFAGIEELAGRFLGFVGNGKRDLVAGYLALFNVAGGGFALREGPGEGVAIRLQ